MATQLAGVPYGPLPRAAKVASALAQPPKLVVIHDTSNDASAAKEAAYAASRDLAGATSAHFYIDTGGPLGSVPLNVQAWAAYGYANRNGWHLEMCGYNAGMPKAVPPQTIANTAALVRRLCELGGIPMVKLSPDDVAGGKRGICGHRDITIGLGVGDHDDPGPHFDWPAFIAAVNGDDMALSPEDIKAIADAIWNRDVDPAAATTQAAYRALDFAQKGVAELKGRPAVIAGPVDPAALKAVFLDPEVLKALAKAVNDDAAARLES